MVKNSSLKSYNYYKLWCFTENKWVYNWQVSTETVVCPNDISHTLDTTLTSVLSSKTDPYKSGFEIVSNSTNIPLGASGTWQGDYENVLNYSEISFIVNTDVSGGNLYIDMSNDGTNIDRTVEYNLLANIPQFHGFSVITKYARLRFINGSIPQSILRIGMIGHVSKSNNLTYKSDEIISRNNDLQLVRIANDAELDLARGIHRNHRMIRIHSINEDVGTALEDVWDLGNYYPWPTGTTGLFNLQVTTANIEDSITGLGARKVRVFGLDSNYDEINEDIDLIGNGTNYSTNQFRRVYETHVIETGTFHGSNYNNINIGISGTNIILSSVRGDGGTINTSDYGLGTSQQSSYTVPRNKTGYITRINVVVDSNKTASLFLYKVTGIDQTPNQPRELLWRIDGFAEYFSINLRSYIEIPEKSDVWFRAKASASAIISVDYDMFLVDN